MPEITTSAERTLVANFLGAAQRVFGHFNNLSIRIKASAAAVILLVCLLAVGINAYVTSTRSASGLRTLSQDMAAKERAFSEVSNAVATAHLMIFRYVSWASNGVSRKLLNQLYGQIERDLFSLSRRIGNLAGRQDLSPQERASLLHVQSKWREVTSQAEDTVNVGQTSPAMATMMLSETDNSFQVVGSDLATLSKSVTTQADHLSNALYTDAQRNKLIIVIGTLAGFIISLFITFVVGRSIVGPIRSITDVMRRLSADETDIEIGYHDRRDELGDMVVAIDAFRRNLIEKHRMEQQLVEMGRDAALEANVAKSQFLATMSHELRTPLNAIIGLTELVVEHAGRLSPERSAESLRRVLGAGRHLLRLINEILDLSKIEAGKMELSIETVGVATLIEDVASTAQPLAAANRNDLVIEAPSEIGAVRADPTRLRQILLNLLSNACKFTKNGQVALRVMTQGSGADTMVAFAVSDTGIGMTPQQLEKLFEEFVQAGASIGRQFGGTGLGLAISRRLCRLMGGDVTVVSEAGKGSTFTATVPLAAAPAPTSAIAAAGAGSAAGTATSGSVLVIDDDATARELMTRQLRALGFQVTAAADGREGLARTRELRPKAIILDVLMPDVLGWDVLTALKNDPDLAGIPVIMATIIDEPRRGLAMGAAGYLTKPIDREQLARILLPYREDRKRFSVLVVDDNADDCEAIADALADIGCEIETAEDGRRALDRMMWRHPDVIILDLMMPNMDGFQVIAAMQAAPELRAIPVIVATAKDLGAEERRRLRVGVVDIIQKQGYSVEEIAERVRTLLTTANSGADPMRDKAAS